MREGDEGNLFFIVNSGQMAQMRNNHVLRKIGVGKHLGERSLLYNQPR
jgi:CRP-like cAMP-binding protein